MIFKELSLRNKLLIFSLPFGLIILVVIGFYFYSISTKLITEMTTKEQIQNSLLIQKMIDDLQTKALVISRLFSQNSAIKEAYLNPDEQLGSDFLKNAIKPTIDSLLKDPDVTDFQIHYHKPPARSFLRTWTKKRFDDISSFRATILKVYETQSSLKAIEFGVGGFAFRGISPIIIDGKYFGSVEFLYEIKDIIKLFSTSNSSIDVFNVVNAQTAEKVLKPEEIQSKYNTKIQNYYLSKANFDWIDYNDLFKIDLLEKMNSSNETIVQEIYSIYYLLIPIFDYKSEKIGYIVVANNQKNTVSEQISKLYLPIFIISTLILIFILVSIFFVNTFIIKPIKYVSDMAIKITKGQLD